MGRINGIKNIQVNIVMMQTSNGYRRLELTKFRNPKLVEIEPASAPPNTLELRSIRFTVESIDDTILACEPTVANSSAMWHATGTCTDSVTCEVLQISSSHWPRSSPEGFTAFGKSVCA
jgi:hypothetical protein